MASDLAHKIAETCAAIADLAEQIEQDHAKLAALKNDLRGYLQAEASGNGQPTAQKPVEKPASRKFFVSEIPWDRAFAALRSKFGAGEFCTDDVVAALAAIRSRPNRSTVRDKLARMAKDELLSRGNGDGIYRFEDMPEKRAA